MADNLDNLAEKLVTEAEAAGGGTGSGSGGEGGGGGSGSGGTPDGDPASDRNLQLILDIPLRVTVELGRTKMPVSELLNLGQGSVIELNKLAGEPMEVLVNDKLIARGEAVVVNEKFGVRLTDIISTKERVEQLK
ncbi:MAG: flagellar motor switch protein FliN [Proteobacteria bacterium]|jgi:flagellar motor switch protein FliN/FliY|nr:flagellar motor switch protein FliN [Pseudomonadota bacterium]